MRTDDFFDNDDALANFDVDAFVEQQRANTPVATVAPPKQPPSAPRTQFSQQPLQPSLSQFLSSGDVAATTPINATSAAPINATSTARPWAVACPADLKTPLFKLFGHEQFRDGQEEAVRATLQGRDACIFWPTGKGKSITYQLPALIADKITVVVSPLVSLMVDQCAKLNHTVGAGRAVAPAIFLGPQQTDRGAEERALSGNGARLIYCSPEKLMMSGLISRLECLHRDGKVVPSLPSHPTPPHPTPPHPTVCLAAPRHRHRRGALRLRVGPRLSRRVPPARRAAAAAAGRADHSAHGDGGAQRQGRHPEQPRPRPAPSALAER